MVYVTFFMPNYRTYIGNRIRTTRKALRMSQMRLAEKIGVSYQQIQKYEKGQSEITLSRLYQISDALGIDPVSILPSKTAMVAESAAPYGRGTSRDEAVLLNLFRQIKNKKIRDSFFVLLKGAAEIEKKRP